MNVRTKVRTYLRGNGKNNDKSRSLRDDKQRTSNSNGKGGGLRFYIPPIASARWMGHPRVCGWLKRTSKCKNKSEIRGFFAALRMTKCGGERGSLGNSNDNGNGNGNGNGKNKSRFLRLRSGQALRLVTHDEAVGHSL